MRARLKGTKKRLKYERRESRKRGVGEPEKGEVRENGGARDSGRVRERYVA